MGLAGPRQRRGTRGDCAGACPSRGGGLAVTACCGPSRSVGPDVLQRALKQTQPASVWGGRWEGRAGNGRPQHPLPGDRGQVGPGDTRPREGALEDKWRTGRGPEGACHVHGPGVTSTTTPWLWPVVWRPRRPRRPGKASGHRPQERRVCREEPTAPHRRSWATSPTFLPGSCPSKALHSGRGSGVGFGDRGWAAGQDANPGLCGQRLPSPRTGGVLALPVAEATSCPERARVTQEPEWKFSSS